MMTGNIALTNLPPEILLKIFSYCYDTGSLSSLARTCSSIYQVYTVNCENLLLSILQRLVDYVPGIDVEAETCILAEDLKLQMTEEEGTESLSRFCEDYKMRRAKRISSTQNFQRISHTIFWTDVRRNIHETRNLQGVCYPYPNNRSIKLVQRIERLHPIIRECVQDFLKFTLERQLSDLHDKQVSLRKQVLSKVELRRIYRAFYRLEIYRQLFGSVSPHEFELRTRLRLWLSIYPPHEVEEIVCAADFLCERWIELSTFRINHNTVPLGHALAYASYNRGQIQSLMAEELSFYLQVSRLKTRDRIDVIISRAGSSLDPYLLKTLRNGPSVRWRVGASIAKDTSLPEPNEFIPFQGDHPDCPNAGWLWGVRNIYQAGAFGMDGYRKFRLLGYTMWDKARLESWPEFKQKPPCEYVGDDDPVNVFLA